MAIKEENIQVVRSFTVQSGVRRIDCGFIEDKEDTTNKAIRIMNNMGKDGKFDFGFDNIKMAYGFEKLHDGTYGLVYSNDVDKDLHLVIFKFNFKTPEIVNNTVILDSLLFGERDYQIGAFKNDKRKPLLTIMVGSSVKAKEGEDPMSTMGSFTSTLYDVDCKDINDIKVEEKPSFSPGMKGIGDSNVQLSPEKQALLQQRLSEYLKKNPPKESDRINLGDAPTEVVTIGNGVSDTIIDTEAIPVD